MRQQQLQRTLKFTEDDLNANRSGRLSDAQRERLEPPKVNRLVTMVIVGHMALIGGILGLIALLTGEAILWLVLLIVLGMAALPFVMMQNEGNLRPVLKADILRGKVASSSGAVFLEPRSNRRVDLLIDGIAVEMSPRQAGAFQHGGEYTVYYLPQSKRLLTAEVLPAE